MHMNIVSKNRKLPGIIPLGNISREKMPLGEKILGDNKKRHAHSFLIPFCISIPGIIPLGKYFRRENASWRGNSRGEKKEAYTAFCISITGIIPLGNILGEKMPLGEEIRGTKKAYTQLSHSLLYLKSQNQF